MHCKDNDFYLNSKITLASFILNNMSSCSFCFCSWEEKYIGLQSLILRYYLFYISDLLFMSERFLVLVLYDRVMALQLIYKNMNCAFSKKKLNGAWCFEVLIFLASWVLGYIGVAAIHSWSSIVNSFLYYQQIVHSYQ